MKSKVYTFLLVIFTVAKLFAADPPSQPLLQATALASVNQQNANVITETGSYMRSTLFLPEAFNSPQATKPAGLHVAALGNPRANLRATERASSIVIVARHGILPAERVAGLAGRGHTLSSLSATRKGTTNIAQAEQQPSVTTQTNYRLKDPGPSNESAFLATTAALAVLENQLASSASYKLERIFDGREGG